MTVKKQLQQYMDITLPEEVLLFHVAMALGLSECFVMALFALLLRTDARVPLLLLSGVFFTGAAMDAENRVRDVRYVSMAYLFLMHVILVPLASCFVPDAVYDFPVYFLTGITFTLILLKKRWGAVYILLELTVDLLCIRHMLENARTAAAIAAGGIQYDWILFGRLIVALSVTGTVCGILISYRNRILRREIDKSVAMEREAEQLSYAKNMFLVNVSHEIRTPLNAILGTTELLFDLDTDDRVKENAYHMANCSKALLSITNEIMDFSKLDDRNLAAEEKPYDLGDICSELINVLSVRYADYKAELFVDIEPDLPKQLCGDEGMLRQAMFEILNGVVKSVESGEVSLHIRREDCAEGRLNLSVEVRAEGAFKHSYEEWLHHSDDGEAEYGENLSLPHRLIGLMGGGLCMEEGMRERRYYFSIPQKYIEGKPLAEKPADSGIRVLFYENTKRQGSALAGTFGALGVVFCQAFDDGLFLEECVKKCYTHVMIASERYDGARERLEELLPPQSLILIGSGLFTCDDPLVRTTFARPVNCMNLSALLGGMQNGAIRRVSYKGGFICPDARIMVVDDNIVNLEVATSLLNRYQAQVSVAASGRECLKMLQQEPVDFIFLDYMMPEMDGIDTLKNIRALGIPALRDIPVVALTANAVSGAREMFLEAGFDEYLSKPIERELFENALRTWLPEDKIIYTANRGEKAGNNEG